MVTDMSTMAAITSMRALARRLRGEQNGGVWIWSLCGDEDMATAGAEGEVVAVVAESGLRVVCRAEDKVIVLTT